MNAIVIVLILLEALFALFLLYRDGLIKSLPRVIIAAVCIGLAMGLRLLAFDYESGDYLQFLTKWVDILRGYGGFAGLKYDIGNYNVPYMYFLAMCPHLWMIRDLYLIKLFSVFFDIVLAFASMRLVRRVTEKDSRALACFLTVMFLPTVFLNGAYWAQCDSIYVSLIVLGIYLALDDRPVLSMVCAALSFGFKLQAVFILPVYAVLWMMGKFNWKHFFVFPAAYILLVLPAVLAGKPFIDTVLLYFNQAHTVGEALNYNSTSIFSFEKFVGLFPNESVAARFGIIAAFVFMFVVLALCFFRRRQLNARAVCAAALLLSVGIPFLLPHMHERYFFGADALSLVLVFVDPMLAAVALLTQFASLLGYYACLKMHYLMPMSRGAWALLLVIALALCSLCKQLFPSKNESKKNLS